jgi:hypothetical protein
MSAMDMNLQRAAGGPHSTLDQSSLVNPSIILNDSSDIRRHLQLPQGPQNTSRTSILYDHLPYSTSVNPGQLPKRIGVYSL